MNSFMFVFVFLASVYSYAEPWMSNRFAQNCSACHSPGRINLPLKDRRCSLSCQGCHVNPSGGGLRNSYGVWNQQRWARSYTSAFFENKGLPAPYRAQKYAAVETTKVQKKPETPQSNGYPLQVYRAVEYKSKDYDRSDRQEFITAKTREEFLSRIPDDDPYRTERQQWIFAGGDFRLLDLRQHTQPPGAPSTDHEYRLPMSFDFGVRVKPTKYKNFQFVFEQRYYNYPVPTNPSKLEPEWISASDGSRVRSAYVLIDDLAYNSYLQYGVYRPLFGINNPDHTGLAQSIMYNTATGQGVDIINADSALSSNKTLSVGTTPNVPFANVHWITPMANPSYSQDNGFAANVGGRFVTLGFSAMLSYWNTKTIVAGADQTKKAIGLNFGGMYKNLVVTADFTQVEKGSSGGALDRGQIQTLDLKYRMLREIYLVLNYARANTTRTLQAGSALETMFGIKSFLLPGTDLEILSVTRTDSSATAGSWDRQQIQAMLHLFF